MDLDQPWEHPDWYDLHDTAWTAGSEREPEHYRELMLALPPLGGQDHLADAGAGTGKLAALIATGYPKLGRVSLIEPNQDKLERAGERLAKVLPQAKIQAYRLHLGEDQDLPRLEATVATVGSVFMPVMELRGGSLANGLAWLRKALREISAMLRPSGWTYILETLAAPWARGSLNDPVRRLNMLELIGEIGDAGFESVECVYRFRDRVTIRARRPM
jgi:SAM-dependent methyltransferase